MVFLQIRVSVVYHSSAGVAVSFSIELGTLAEHVLGRARMRITIVMSKLYKGKTCVYCAKPEAALTGDHVIARSFFSLDERDNLPQVPTCAPCNNVKSALETYLSALLPQGAQHQGDASSYWTDSRRRIEKNQKLKRDLQAGAYISSQIDANGKPISAPMLPIDASKLLDLAKYIAKGLLFYHWKVIVPEDQVIHCQFMGETGESIFSDMIKSMQSIAADHGSDDFIQFTGLTPLGRQTVTYEGFFVPADAPFSVWRLNFYRAKLGVPGAQEFTSDLMMLIQGTSGVPAWFSSQSAPSDSQT